MTRLVFQLAGSVGPDNIPHIEISLEEPSIFGSLGRPFACTGEEEPFSALRDAPLGNDAILQAGRYLFDAVMQHPDLAEHLPTALQTQYPDRYPVFVELATGAGVEALPWEALCSHKGEFLGLDERWAVGRIVDSPAVSRPYWHFTPPLRFAAILSCLGVPAGAEWQAIREALTTAPGFDVTQLLIVSEESLYTELSALADEHPTGGKAPPFTVELIPPELDQLQESIKRYRPHILHFFCHGSVEGGPHLLLATKSDWERGDRPSIPVEAREFRDFTKSANDPPWLTVLNCCEGAAAPSGSEDLQSLALQLVNRVGLPAVIGMREPIASDDAHLFTQFFYERLLMDLMDRVLHDASGPGNALDWAMLTVPARRRLAKKNIGTLTQGAASSKEWTLPVVYTQPKQAEIRFVPPEEPMTTVAPPEAGWPTQVDDEQLRQAKRRVRLEIEALQGIRAQLPPGSPPELLQEIDELLGELMSQLEQP